MMKLTYGAHVALLDTEHGIGLLIEPDPSHDIELDAGPTLQQSDYESAFRNLASRGWEPLYEPDGTFLDAGLVNGTRGLVALADGRVTEFDPEGESHAWTALHEVAACQQTA